MEVGMNEGGQSVSCLIRKTGLYTHMLSAHEGDWPDGFL